MSLNRCRNVRSSFVFILLVAAGSALAQQPPAPVSHDAATLAPAPQTAPKPLQSPAADSKPTLATASDTSALASAVAGTCTVIDAIMMDICAQTPKDDYCRQ